MKRIILVIALVCTLPSLAIAEPRKGNILAGVGVGFTVHPMAFDGQAAGEYYWRDSISFLMAFDTFANSSGATFNFMPMARYHFDIAEAPKLVPFGGIGLGVAVSTGGDGAMSIAAPDCGVDYKIANNVYLSTDMSFLHLTDFDGYTWAFRWAVLGVKFEF